MLRIVIEGEEVFDEEVGSFIKTTPDLVLELEHSLVSVSKWESEFEIAFLGKAPKTDEQVAKYVQYMITNHDEVIPDLATIVSPYQDLIQEYIVKENSATRLMKLPSREDSRETVTSDLIYYWMIALQIPWEAQYWHINRLMTLIDLTQRKSNPSGGKMNKSDMARQRASINRARRRGGPG